MTAPIHPPGTAHWTQRHPARVARGPDASNAKLSRAQLHDLAELWQAGARNQTALGRRFGVCRKTIGRQLKAMGLR